MFKTRLLVGLALTPVAIYIMYLGGWVYAAVITLVLLLGTREYVTLIDAREWHLPGLLLMTGVLAYLLTATDLPYLQPDFVFSLFLFLALLYVIFTYERGGGGTMTPVWMSLIGGFVLFGWVGRHLLLLRELENGFQWTFAVVALTWMADTMAYLIGSWLGRHKLTPTLSPNKSIEGYIGGIVMGIAGAAVFKYFFMPDIAWSAFVILGLILTPLVPAGDLGFSLLKREAGAKDASRLIPGHGGILDRFDALIWGSMIGYYAITYLFMP